jgi:hypothetical protein
MGSLVAGKATDPLPGWFAAGEIYVKQLPDGEPVQLTNDLRFTRLTNGFSKKLENHIHSVALHCIHYNFARIHKTLRVTPSMAAGISDHDWSLEEIALLAE